ncbi:MAG TPA: 16S rRNA (cytidine(1402)-2'-O)-methyltransferase [Myxococcales bacterium]|nr:16S rRNA (cytidine(1402)-2'-O)-methyltransferase [Myxococcales bacterium]
MPLYVVATPIGNLQDLTERAREVLAACDAVVAEDTRHTGQLLKHLGIEKKPFLALPAYDEAGRADALLRRLAEGSSLALVTDAGTPGISDPGALLVRRAVEQGYPVVPVPGPSAAISAVSVSGFAQPRFHFAGFLPRKVKARAGMLDELRPLRAQLVFYESPHRLAATLGDLQAALGDRPALVARELTKVHEELARGTLSQLAARFSNEVRGEIVIVVSGASAVEEEQEDPSDLEREVRERLERGERPKEIAEALSGRHGKREVYQLALKLKGS